MQLRIFNKTLPTYSGEFHFLSSKAWGDREQCLTIACLTTRWHLILKRRGSQRCFFCGEPDVKRRPQGWKNENANDPEGAWTDDTLLDIASNHIFPTPFCILILSYILKFFLYYIHNWKTRTRRKKEHFTILCISIHFTTKWLAPFGR